MSAEYHGVNYVVREVSLVLIILLIASLACLVRHCCMFMSVYKVTYSATELGQIALYCTSLSWFYGKHVTTNNKKRNCRTDEYHFQGFITSFHCLLRTITESFLPCGDICYCLWGYLALMWVSIGLLCQILCWQCIMTSGVHDWDNYSHWYIVTRCIIQPTAFTYVWIWNLLLFVNPYAWLHRMNLV